MTRCLFLGFSRVLSVRETRPRPRQSPRGERDADVHGRFYPGADR